VSTPPDQSERRPEGYDPPGYEPATYEPPEDGYGFQEPQRDYRPVHPEPAWRSIARRLWAPIVFVGLMLWKFKFIFAAIFKFKLFTVAGSMLVSIAAYALLWGWQFAFGFVVLLFVHELGHVIEARRQGLPVSAPLFIPFLGAMIMLKGNPEDAWREAKVAIAGPILGSLGALVTWGLGEAYDSDLLIALAFTGFFLNLFNLLPIVPLDGGRIVAAVHPVLWGLGLLGLLGLAFVAPNPILIVILVIGGLELWRRWKEWRHPTPEVTAYYRVTPSQRIAAGLGYIGLAVLLVLAMAATFVERDL
jgi:Zn-dependent protease